MNNAFGSGKNPVLMERIIEKQTEIIEDQKKRIDLLEQLTDNQAKIIDILKKENSSFSQRNAELQKHADNLMESYEKAVALCDEQQEVIRSLQN